MVKVPATGATPVSPYNYSLYTHHCSACESGLAATYDRHFKAHRQGHALPPLNFALLFQAANHTAPATGGAGGIQGKPEQVSMHKKLYRYKGYPLEAVQDS